MGATNGGKKACPLKAAGMAPAEALASRRNGWVFRLSLDSVGGQLAQVLEQVRQRRHQLLEVAFVQALVGRVRVRLRVLDAQQQGRRAAEQLGQRPDEADGAATADRHRVAVEALPQTGQRRL